jgi:hypothetical protein
MQVDPSSAVSIGLPTVEPSSDRAESSLLPASRSRPDSSLLHPMHALEESLRPRHRTESSHHQNREQQQPSSSQLTRDLRADVDESADDPTILDSTGRRIRYQNFTTIGNRSMARLPGSLTLFILSM